MNCSPKYRLVMKSIEATVLIKVEFEEIQKLEFYDNYGCLSYNR